MKAGADFKMVVVVDEELPIGLQANTAAVLSLSLGHKIEGLIGKNLIDGGGNIHQALTTIPLPILKCKREILRDLYQSSYKLKDELLLIDITDAAQTTKNYSDYEEKLKNNKTVNLELLGVALAGPKKLINKLTGHLALLK